MRPLTTLAIATLLTTGLAGLAEAQTRMAGEWQVRVVAENGKRGWPRNYCYSQGSVADVARDMGDCSRTKISTLGNKTTIDAICPVGTRQASFHTTITSKSPTAYHTEMRFTYSPPEAGVGEVHMMSDARWLRPCPMGMKPVR